MLTWLKLDFVISIQLMRKLLRRLMMLRWRSFYLPSVFLMTATALILAFSSTSPAIHLLRYSDTKSSSKLHGNIVFSFHPPPPFIESFDDNNEGTKVVDMESPTLDSKVRIVAVTKTNNNEVHSSIASSFHPPPPSDESIDDDKEGNKVAMENSTSDFEVHTVATTKTSNNESLNKSKLNDASSDSGDLKEDLLNLKRRIELTGSDKQLIHAKKEIENALVVFNDPDLYAPLFKNVSIFKRSYELMETILRVYIYRDGGRPIFHTPALKGIYASEGWFQKQIESNRKYVVKDPKKAHLFYLPYSARQMELYLYKPDSHNLEPLAIFVKNYVDSLSAKYPFWNRTSGSDHFLVACHDWGLYTTTLHEELSKNSIRALCNADSSEGFVRGKDVSLPETLIINQRRPLRNIGGKPVSQRNILAFFAGNMHGPVRPILVNYWSGKDEEMKIYGPLPPQIARKFSYSEHMKSSKFCLCPMGYEVNSPRIVEAIYYECVPVIIANNFVLPFDDVLNWGEFSVVVKEKDIPNLKGILLGISLWKYITMHENVKRLQRHFLWHKRPEKYDIFHMILHSVWSSRLSQVQEQA